MAYRDSAQKSFPESQRLALRCTTLSAGSREIRVIWNKKIPLWIRLARANTFAAKATSTSICRPLHLHSYWLNTCRIDNWTTLLTRICIIEWR